jgi:hypothetical protein
MILVASLSAISHPFAMLVAYLFGQERRRAAFIALASYMTFDVVYTLVYFALIGRLVDG